MRPWMALLAAIGPLATLSFAPAWSALSMTGRWDPISNAGEAITGEITLTHDAIRFQYGRTALPLAEYDRDDNGIIYEVTDPVKLRLRNGNMLCQGPVTWVRVTPMPQGEAAFTFYESEDPPAVPDEGACLWSVYVRVAR